MTNDSELGNGLTCFIVSPIGNRLEPLGSPGRARYEESILMWEDVYEPACLAFGIAPVRSDRISDTGEIPDQIFTYLRDADVVIADLSHANPNVMYELGLRHSRPDKITIQIGEHGYLPFDVTTIRTIQFNRTRAGLIGARDELVEALRTALNGGGTPLRATAIFTSAPPIEATAINSDVQKSMEPEKSEAEVEGPGVLEVMAEGETAIVHIAGVLGDSGVRIEEVGALMTDSTAAIQESDAKNGGFAGRLLIARDLGEKLSEPSAVLESLSNEFYSDVSRMDVMVQYVIERYRSGEEDPADGAPFFTSMLGLIEAADQGAVGIVGFRDGAKSMSKFSKALVPASKILTSAANRFLEGISTMLTWREPLTELSEK